MFAINSYTFQMLCMAHLVIATGTVVILWRIKSFSSSVVRSPRQNLNIQLSSKELITMR